MANAHLFLKDLKAGDEVTCVYFCKNAKIRSAKNGQRFVQSEIQDRTGILPGFFWNATDKVVALFENDGHRQLLARAEKFQGHIQLNIKEAIEVPQDRVDAALYIPTAPIDLEAYKQRLLALGSRLKKPGFVALFKAFFEDKTFLDGFVAAPAAREMHHAYFGGLLYHSVTVAESAERLAASYPALDKDLLIMGALLHDIGKMEEIRLTQQVADRNSMPLIGHIALGVLWLEERAKKIDTLSETDRHALQHIQVSHHGELEYGSPLVPQIPEAMVVHFLDNLDARVTTALEQLNKAEPGGWTPYSKIHGTYLYRKE